MRVGARIWGMVCIGVFVWGGWSRVVGVGVGWVGGGRGLWWGGWGLGDWGAMLYTIACAVGGGGWWGVAMGDGGAVCLVNVRARRGGCVIVRMGGYWRGAGEGRSWVGWGAKETFRMGGWVGLVWGLGGS